MNDFSNFSFFPIKYPKLIECYDKLKATHWIPNEITFQDDLKTWETTDPEIKELVKFILCFFAGADGIVIDNLVDNFKKETSFCKEIKYSYSAQEFNEVVHNETYSKLIYLYMQSEDERNKAFNSMVHYPPVMDINNWAINWMKSDRPLTERIIAFACVEGILFSSSFAFIYWIKRKNILPGLCKANEWIARDESVHTALAVSIYHHLTMIFDKDTRMETLEQDRVHDIIKSAVDVTNKFTESILTFKKLDMSVEKMNDYVRCTANVLSTSLGYSDIYDVKNPFPWMILISLPNRSDFFETDVTEYSRQNDENSNITFDDDLDI